MSYKQLYIPTRRLGNDNYNRPRKTIQDKLTPDEIKEKLKDYKEVRHIKDLNIGDHLRYFTIVDNSRKFRLGGELKKIDDSKKYLVLSNGLATWSVQLENSIIYRKLRNNETGQSEKKSYSDTNIDESREKLKHKLSEYKSAYGELSKQYDSLLKENEKLKKKLREYIEKYKK